MHRQECPVRRRYQIIAGKGATFYGISRRSRVIVDVLLHDQRAIPTICTRVTGVRDYDGVTLRCRTWLVETARWPRFLCRLMKRSGKDFAAAPSFCARRLNRWT